MDKRRAHDNHDDYSVSSFFLLSFRPGNANLPGPNPLFLPETERVAVLTYAKKQIAHRELCVLDERKFSMIFSSPIRLHHRRQLCKCKFRHHDSSQRKKGLFCLTFFSHPEPKSCALILILFLQRNSNQKSTYFF